MAGKRLARLNEQFRREISELLRTQVRDPRVGVPTVTGVDVTADLWLARVRVRLEGTPEERTEALTGLETAAPFIRRALGKSLTIRRVPELRFLEDRGLEEAMRIEALLREVLPGEGVTRGGEDSQEDESPLTGPERDLDA
ncbi:MAG: 30S ribosome-binding factor RbfA [Gemmatimonadota bacterium]